MIDWQMLKQWQGDWVCPSQEGLEVRMDLYRRATSFQRGQFVNALAQVRGGQERLIERYAFGYADQLQHDSGVASTKRLDRLLELAGRSYTEARVREQVWFEAIGNFDQAIGCWLVEQQEPEEVLGDTMLQLVDLMQTELFTAGYERVDFHAYHDPDREYIVEEGDVGVNQELHRPGLRHRKKHLMCRRVAGNLLVCLNNRIKDPYRTYLKSQRQRHNSQDPQLFRVRDRCGFMFIVPTTSDVLSLAQSVLALMVSSGAKVIQEFKHNFDESVAVDQSNAHSSGDHKLGKMLLSWRGQFIEYQFLTAAGYFSSMRALTDRNHELYKLRQVVSTYFPMLWPERLFHVDWSSPLVRQALSRWKISQLGWAVKAFDASDE